MDCNSLLKANISKLKKCQFSFFVLYLGTNFVNHIIQLKKIRDSMKLKNILAIVAISATTAILSVWGYGEVMKFKYAGIQ